MSACTLGCSGCFVARQRGKDMVLTKGRKSHYGWGSAARRREILPLYF